MKCEIIRDLMPLYLDDCCSEGSRRLVKEHIEECDSCRKLLEEMSQELIIDTEEKRKNLLEEELLKTGKEVIKAQVQEKYLENIIWMDIPLNILIFIFGVYAMLKCDSNYLLYDYENISKAAWDKAVLFDIYSSIGNPYTLGLTLYFLTGEIMYLLSAKKKRQTAVLTCIAIESVFHKAVMLATFAVIGFMLMQ